ncbi:2OG-Fe(II) oxygenase [Luteibacter anthropi]|uniref:2OG-Fe(II) oxygenase n=1 Tax=Luteibacter anthropi TaxID=564369 RepID=UPI0020323EBA|nr:2OG-Fe(II) oxygenase [Luteibacter anthropi]URX61741.1 2OG-Fe(II) oxygenase [Luteibacter anthropi]
MSVLDDDVIARPPIGQVDIHDHLVPEALRRSLMALMRRPIWAYGWKSVRERDRYGFWHAHFAGGEENETSSCEDALARLGSEHPVFALWSLLSEGPLRGHRPIRVYANGHTYGTEGYIHTDNQDPRCYTAIYYAHGAWDADWSGETSFLSAETGDILHAVLPMPGRLVLFNGATPHVARGVSRECPELRISLVVKTFVP